MDYELKWILWWRPKNESLKCWRFGQTWCIYFYVYLPITHRPGSVSTMLPLYASQKIFSLKIPSRLHVARKNARWTVYRISRFPVPYTSHCWFLRLFCPQPLHIEWPPSSSSSETLSGLLAIKPQDIYFSQAIGLPCFAFFAAVWFIHRKSLFVEQLSCVEIKLCM